MTTFEPPPVPFPDPAWAEEILPQPSTVHWYAPDGVTRITTTEANYLLGSPAKQVAYTTVQDWTVSTLFLALDHNWMALEVLGQQLGLTGEPGEPETAAEAEAAAPTRAHVLWETVTFPGHLRVPGDELPETIDDNLRARHASLRGALAGHEEAVAAIVDYLGLTPADVVHDPRAAQTPAAQGRRVWWT